MGYTGNMKNIKKNLVNLFTANKTAVVSTESPAETEQKSIAIPRETVHNGDPVKLVDRVYNVIKHGKLIHNSDEWSTVKTNTIGLWTIELEDGNRFRTNGCLYRPEWELDVDDYGYTLYTMKPRHAV